VVRDNCCHGGGVVLSKSFIDAFARRDSALVVEDSFRELNSAVAAGIECAIVDNAFTREQDFTAASYRIEALIELKDIIL
jgi:beta-phosphoglucomutase-like phosphatase (HAD superfamily)